MSKVVIDGQTDARAVMLYDGLCGFCNRTVQWLLKHDHYDRFRFAPQQSSVAAAILARHGIDREKMLKDNSVYLVLDPDTGQERLLTQSDVTVNLLLLLGGGWRVLGSLLRAIPRAVRDAAYTVAARNRYHISGRYEVCPVPSEAERKKFLG
jgi:predicted DCC family thiol-disulfide oxidoreductase YuxK